MRPRAGLYSRFSSDRQSDQSIADQERLTTRTARDRGFEVVARWSDEAVSGSIPAAQRPGSAAMLAAAMTGQIDVLVIEGLDRLSRDMVDSEQIVRRLEHAGIRIIGVSDGYDSESQARKLQRGMRALINDVYLDDLRAKTHRGLAGRAEAGMSAGGRAYGYRTEDAPGGRRLVIEPIEAGWVRWIYEHYAAGRSPQWLAHELNRQGVRSARGGTWAVSAIFGRLDDGRGVLCNPLYRGRMIWNRARWVRDPDTHRRIRIDRPREEWITTDMPDLRIISEEQWQAALARRKAPRHAGGSNGKGGVIRTLFGGVLRCAACGGAVVAVSRTAYGCAARKDRGPAVCPGVRMPREIMDRILAGHIRDDLLSPRILADLQTGIARMREDRLREGRERRQERAERRAAIDREIGNVVTAIAAMGGSAALHARLRELEADLADLDRPVAGPGPDVMAEARAMLAEYRRRVMDLTNAIDDATDRAEARELIVGLLGPVTLEQRGLEVWATMGDGASAILGMVAGAGFSTRNQPPSLRTFRVL